MRCKVLYTAASINLYSVFLEKQPVKANPGQQSEPVLWLSYYDNFANWQTLWCMKLHY